MNVELMEKVEALINAHPGQHSQSWWSSNDRKLPTEDCNTSCCIAGWTAAALGFTVADIEVERGLHIDQWAAEQLGIDSEERYRLFHTLGDEAALEHLHALIEEGKAGA